MDLALTVPALVALAPLMGGVALLVRRKLGSPVLFAQERPGLNERPFRLYKFRTMTNEVDASGEPLPDRHRLTRLGRTLRALSLDELPALLNVLKGEMSLVGPRPLLMRYLPHYTERERARHSVLPGITGWAQIHGRNEVSWDRRLEYDVWYVENGGLALDLRILARTAGAVLRRDGVVVDPESVMLNLDEARQARASRPTRPETG